MTLLYIQYFNPLVHVNCIRAADDPLTELVFQSTCICKLHLFFGHYLDVLFLFQSTCTCKSHLVTGLNVCMISFYFNPLVHVNRIDK